MKHPGTFNANPLSAAAGVATLRLVASGEPTARANATGAALRRRLNAAFAEHNLNWVAYGEFSGFRLIPDYDGPAPQGDDFIPCNGDLEKLDGPVDRRKLFAFRQAMLLHGVDLPGFSGMLTAAHSERDIDQTVEAVVKSAIWMRQEGI